MPFRAEVIGTPLKGLQDNLSRNMGRSLRLGMKAWGAVIDEEFAGGFWYMPAGGKRPWAPVLAFGNVPANSTPLQRSGRLRGAYRAAAEGGGVISASTKTTGTAELRINVPGGYAAVHRGGTGKLLSGDIAPLRIAVTPRMRGFLGAVKGVHLRKGTKFITIPRRPHATSNPKIRGQLRYLFAQFGANKPLPKYGGA